MRLNELLKVIEAIRQVFIKMPVFGMVESMLTMDSHGEKSRIAMTRQFSTTPFLLVGDWNITPEELEATSFLRDLNAQILTPEGAAITCRQGAGTLIDFMVVSKSLLGIAGKPVLDFSGPP